MYYSEDIIEDIRLGNDIVEIISSYITLKQKGLSYIGLCPFHNEKTPSFNVSIDKQLFYCFGCGASGNVFSFIMQIENLDFVESVKFLAEKINYDLPKNNYKNNKDIISKKELIYNINKIAARFFYDNINSLNGSIAKKYLDMRKINNNMRIKYGLGYATKYKDNLYKYLISKNYDIDIILESGLVLKNKNGSYFDRFRDRLMFPIINVHNKIVGFGGRIIENGEPKYLNSSENIVFEKSKNLYNINFAKESKLKEFILVEGYIDVITLYQYGIYNVVAALGTSFNSEHAKILKKYADTVIICFDSDIAGINATLRTIPILLERGLKVKVLNLKNAKDPDEYIKKFGVNRLKKEILNVKSHLDFQIDIILKKYNINKLEEKVMFTEEVSNLLSKINSNIELDVYIKEISKITEISELAIKNEIDKKKETIDYNLHKYTYKRKNDIKSKGLIEAKKNLIYLIASDFKIYKTLKQYLSPPEMVDKIYIQILETIYKLYENNKNICTADIVSYFENIKDQKIVSEIFINNLEPLNIENIDINKLINDQLKLVKKKYIEEEINKTNDIKKLKILIDKKRNIENLNMLLVYG